MKLIRIATRIATVVPRAGRRRKPSVRVLVAVPLASHNHRGSRSGSVHQRRRAAEARAAEGRAAEVSEESASKR